MKKYNKPEIMKNAWAMKNSWYCRSLTFAECLRRAWSNAKTEIENEMVSDTFVDGMDITIDGYTRTLNRWTKGGHDRVYINYGLRKSEGFVDLVSGRMFLKNKQCIYC